MPIDDYTYRWALDDGSGGTAADVGANDLDVNLTDTTWIAGHIGASALQFNGTSSFGATEANFDIGSDVITVAFWLWIDSFDSSDSLTLELSPVFFANNDSFCIDFDVDVGGAKAFLNSNGILCRQFDRPPAAEWHHWAIVFDNSTNSGAITVYRDGSVVSTLDAGNGKTTSGNFRTDTLYFMSRGGVALFQPGRLDEVRIYDRALSAGEIAELYAWTDQATPRGFAAVMG